MGQGGLRINMIPKDGGNTFRGSVFANYTGESWNGDNLTDDLKARGLTNVSKVHRIYDVNPSFGGPIKRDKLWFQATFRRQGLEKTVVDSYFDTNPDPIRYTADLDRPGVDDGYIMSGVGRLTWQASTKHKITGYYDRQDKLREHWGISSTNPPEASAIQETPSSYTGNIKWTAPLTSKLLFEAGYGHYYQEYDELYQPGVTPTTYRIVDQTTGRACCAYTSQQFHFSTLRTYSTKLSLRCRLAQPHRRPDRQRRAAPHVDRSRPATSPCASARRRRRHTHRGFGPNQVTLNLPTDQREGIYADTGLWVNDKWTISRATITAGPALRLVHRRSARLGDSRQQVVAGRHLYGLQGRAELEGPVPRLGFAYDVFGNGKTAIKASVRATSTRRRSRSRQEPNPIGLLDSSEALTWTDDNGDFTIFNPDGSVQDRDFNPGSPANGWRRSRPVRPSGLWWSRTRASTTRSARAGRARLPVGVHRRHQRRAVPARVGELQLLPPLHGRQHDASRTTATSVPKTTSAV